MRLVLVCCTVHMIPYFPIKSIPIFKEYGTGIYYAYSEKYDKVDYMTPQGVCFFALIFCCHPFGVVVNLPQNLRQIKQVKAHLRMGLNLFQMHTFSHLLIKQMAMSSGYSSAAIRERIYFGEKVSGILLYTGSADKEGSLGGLVELGNIDRLFSIMHDVFQEALLCTNDPECMNNMPAGNNSNGAACHSCCMISETACENGNRILDRGLVVPVAGRETQAYFRELVAELCQLAI